MNLLLTDSPYRLSSGHQQPFDDLFMLYLRLSVLSGSRFKSWAAFPGAAWGYIIRRHPGMRLSTFWFITVCQVFLLCLCLVNKRLDRQAALTCAGRVLHLLLSSCGHCISRIRRVCCSFCPSIRDVCPGVASLFTLAASWPAYLQPIHSSAPSDLALLSVFFQIVQLPIWYLRLGK